MLKTDVSFETCFEYLHWDKKDLIRNVNDIAKDLE